MSKRGTGDIVTMPLPTEWAPDPSPGVGPLPPAGAAPSPGSSRAVSGGLIVPGGTAGGGPAQPGSGVFVPAPVSGALPPGTARTWSGGVVLPDAQLPPALQRSNPAIQWVPYVPNRHDFRIMQEAYRWSWIAAHGGLKSCCRIPELGAPVYDTPPWIAMPSNAVPVDKIVFQPIANVSGGPPFDGTDTILGTFQVPNGWDGVINRFVCSFTGDNFTDFSGSIAWRLKVANRFVRNLGNVVNTFGSYETAFRVPATDHFRLVSGQTVYMIAAVPNGSPVANGAVTAGVFGWLYPRR